MFVDESKHRGYRLAATTVPDADLSTIERALRQMRRRGQNRIHFKGESDRSRRTLLASMCRLGTRTTVYEVRGRSDHDARTQCLLALVADLETAGAHRLVLERDESVQAADRRTLRDALRVATTPLHLRYEHTGPAEHPVLWVSDAVAWCLQAGGDWVRRADPLIEAARKLR